LQQSFRPYVTSGIALVSAGVIAVTPMAPAPPGPQARDVQLTDTDSTYTDLIGNTTDNLQNIAQGADLQDITTAVGALFTRPLDVLGALTDLNPDIGTDLSGLPAQVTVDLPPALAIGVAGLGAFGTTVGAIHDVIGDLMDGDSSGASNALIDAPGKVLDAYLNGTSGIDLLGGVVNIPLFNGVLAPDQSLDVDVNLTKLLDGLGLGNLDLSDLDLNLDELLHALHLGDLDLGELLDKLGLSDEGLGDLLGGGHEVTLGAVLGELGLGDLDLGSFSLSDLLGNLPGLDKALDLDLTDVLDGLGLNPDLNDLSLSDVLDPLGLNAVLGNLGLNNVIDALGLNADLSDLDLGNLLDALGLDNLQLGDLLGDAGLLSGILDGLNGILSGILGTLGLGDLKDALNDVDLGQLLSGVLLGSGQDDDTLSLTGLLDALGIGGNETDDSLTISGLVESLLGAEPTTDTSLGGLITDILGSAGVDIPDTGELHISDLLEDLLGSAGLPATDDLTLGSLLDDLNIFNLNVTDLLNNVNLGDLLDTLGLSDFDLNLSDVVTDLSNLDINGLLDDLGLSDIDLADISVNPFGGLVTELVDDLPGQIAEALGGSSAG
jgi:hypothetical protein